MLGRKDYTQEEFDAAKRTIEGQIAAYEKLATAVERTGDAKAKAALDSFERLFADNMVLALDRFFVHRIRKVSGADGNPLNEVELLVAALLDGTGELRTNNVIKYAPDRSVLKLEPGERIVLTATDFGRLAKAFLAELDARFVGAA